MVSATSLPNSAGANTDPIATLRLFVRELTGITMPELLPDRRINSRLAMAYRELEGEEDWPWLDKTVSQAGTLTETQTVEGTATVPVPDNPETVWITETASGDRSVLERIPHREMEELLYDGSDEPADGTPYLWSLASAVSTGGSSVSTTDAVIALYPVPDEAFTLNIRTRTPDSSDPYDDIVSGTDSFIEFDYRYLPALGYRAAVMLLAEMGDESQRASAYMQEYMTVLDQMRDRYLSSNDSGLLQMGGNLNRHRRMLVGRMRGDV